MEKKRILVCSHWLEIGGAERALIGLLECLVKSEYEVDLFLCRHSGALFPYIPKGVRLLAEDPNAASIAIAPAAALKRGALGVLTGRVWGKLRARAYCKKHRLTDSNVAIEYSHLYTYRFVRPINPETKYDAVFSFLAPHYIAARKTRGQTKLAWIHTDYQTVAADPEEGLTIWSEFDKIVAISQQCANHFITLYPSLRDRVVLVENIIPAGLTDQQKEAFSAEQEMPRDGSIRLLSVGRYCAAKNFDNVPDLCARLVRMGHNVKWYIIGFGGDEELIRRKIKEAGMDGRVILLGKRDNPYPYMAVCDLYVQPSRYEGKCICVLEAQMLGKPVVITAYPTAASQLEDGVDGIIVPLDNEGCAQGIADLLDSPEKMGQFAKTCCARDYSNAPKIEKLYQLIED